MLGVLRRLAEHVAGRTDARLVLVGPAVDRVTDDPRAAASSRSASPPGNPCPAEAREAVRLVMLPMDDTVVNAQLVNTVQRQASVVVQKSIQEGFGLTVTEAMWKSRPVVASAVGGIVDQVAPDCGVLLDDPHDLDAFGRTLVDLLAYPADMAAIGRRARRHVRAHFLIDRHLRTTDGSSRTSPRPEGARPSARRRPE